MVVAILNFKTATKIQNGHQVNLLTSIWLDSHFEILVAILTFKATVITKYSSNGFLDPEIMAGPYRHQNYASRIYRDQDLGESNFEWQSIWKMADMQNSYQQFHGNM